MFKKKEIKTEVVFYPWDEYIGAQADGPVPAKKMLPDWFKSIPKYSTKNKKYEEMETMDLTIRACVPFFDTLRYGYLITLPTDVEVTRNNDGTANMKFYQYKMTAQPITKRMHNNPYGKEDIHYLPEFEGYDKLQYNWAEFWGIKTPPGYSILSIHPLNRIDLPFYTLGGIINTDKWGVNGNHPFILKKNWQGIIPKGTPIMQIIPFKREDWTSREDRTIMRYDGNCLEEEEKVLKHYYRDNLWKPVKYE